MTIFTANVTTAAFRNPSILHLIPLILLLLSPPPASTSAYTPSSVHLSPPSSTPWCHHHLEHHRRSSSTTHIKRSTSGLTKIAFTTTRSRLGTTTTTVLESTARHLELWLDTTTDVSSRNTEEEDDNDYDASSNNDDRLNLYQMRAAASTTVIIRAAHSNSNSNSNNPIEIDPIGGGSAPSTTPRTTFLQRGEDNRLRRYSTTTTTGNSDSEIVGVVVDPSTSTGIDSGMAAMGSTEWVVALPPLASSSSSSSWNMIPAENLVGAARGTGTKIAFSLIRAGDAAGLEGALQLGIDALCIPLTATQEIWDAAIRATLARNDQIISNEAADADATGGADKKPITAPRIVSGICWRAGSASSSITAAAVRADRVCIDLVQTLSVTEGCWIGSSVKIMALVLSEAAVSALVPSRPFRVNAGPVHSYVLMGDGLTTRYLSELTAGDEVLVYDAQTGQSRAVAIGRLKTEVRPCVMVGLVVVGGGMNGCGVGEGEEEEEEKKPNNRWESDAKDDVVGQIFLQQAETVRLGQSEGSYVRVTSLLTLDTNEQENDSRKAIQGDTVLLRIVGTGTHIGRAYSGKVLER